MLENEPELEKYKSTEDTPTEREFADESELTTYEATNNAPTEDVSSGERYEESDEFWDNFLAVNLLILAISILHLVCLTVYVLKDVRLTMLGIIVTILVDITVLILMMYIPNKLINIVFRKHPEHRNLGLFAYALVLIMPMIITLNGGLALTY